MAIGSVHMMKAYNVNEMSQQYSALYKYYTPKALIR